VPLLPQIQHYLIAGSLTQEPWLRDLFGDSLVPVRSALAGEKTPAREHEGLPVSHVRVLGGRSHVALAHDPEVYTQLRAWISA
jgi:triacylglycerol lipase